MSHRSGTWGRARSRLSVAIALLSAPLLTACDLDTLLEANDPFTVTPQTAQDTANLETLYAGARAQFALGYAGWQNNEGGIVMMSALMSDEMYSSDNFSTRQAVDQRNIDYEISNAASDHAFIYLQRARAEALNAIDIFVNSPRNGNPRHAELYNIAGYSVVLLAENFCAGIPLSRISEGGTEFGTPMMAPELYNLAISYFDAALAMPNAGATQHNLARVGKARALQDLDRHAEAAAVAAQVPSSFGTFNVQYSAGSFYTPNAIFNMNNEEKRFSVSLQEGTVNQGLPYGAVSVTDPRVSIDLNPVPSNRGGGVVTYLQLKYPSQSAPVPLASALEARLIEAEAQLNKGASAAYLTTLNALRASFGLSALTDPGTPAGRVDQFFAQRAYFLWLQGHRLSDLRRLIRQYGRTESQVFPTGRTVYDAAYGDDVSLPLPHAEINNPNYTTCSYIGA